MPIELRTERGTGQRAVFVGNTNSGKTFLMQRLAAPMDSCVVIDSKADDSWRNFAAAFDYTVSGDPADIRRHPRVIFRVDTRSLIDRAGWRRFGDPGHLWTEALQSLWWRTEHGADSTLVIFDEGFDTMPSAGGAHPEAQRIFSSGRTQGLPAWLGAQLPVYVDRRALSQSEHCFSFAQPIAEYRELIRQRRGVPCDVLGELDYANHEFAHHQLGEPGWTEFGPINAAVTRAPLSLPAEYADEQTAPN